MKLIRYFLEEFAKLIFYGVAFISTCAVLIFGSFKIAIFFGLDPAIGIISLCGILMVVLLGIVAWDKAERRGAL